MHEFFAILHYRDAVQSQDGFHRIPGVTAKQQREMDDLVRKVMQSAGVSENFIMRVLATPSEQMWYPSAEEMRLAGVVTSQSYGDRFANSWSDIAMQKEFNESPLYITIRELEPETYAKMMADFTTAIRSGKSEGEAATVVSQTIAGLMGKYLPTASDEALLALRDYWIATVSRYKDNNSQGCIAVFTNAKINPSRVFPDWNTKSIFKVVEKLMRNSAARLTVPVDERAAKADLDDIFEVLGDKYGDDLLILENEDQWMANSQKVCDMLLAKFKQIEALPPKRAANLMRYFVTSED